MNNEVQKNKTNSSVMLLRVAALFIPLVPLVAMVSAGLAFFFAVFNKGFQYISRSLSSNKPAGCIFLVYVAYVASTFVSSDVQRALNDLFSKCPFVICPLLFLSLPRGAFRRNLATEAFSIGTGLMCLYLVARALVSFQKQGDVSVFFYEKFSGKFHPTYLAIFIGFSLVSLLHYIHSETNRLSPVLSGLFFCLGTTALILTSSRMGIIAGFLSMGCIILGFFLKGKNISKGRLIFYLAAPFLLFTLLNYGLNNASRFGEVKYYVNSTEKSDEGSIGARIKIWEASGDLIRANFWTGTGTGDVQEELRKLYERDGLHYALRKNLNAHNQFLQTLLATGIFGLMALLAALLIPFIKSFREKDFLAISFLVIVTLNSLTEAFLEREAGVLWFAFFYGLLFCNNGHLKPGTTES